MVVDGSMQVRRVRDIAGVSRLARWLIVGRCFGGFSQPFLCPALSLLFRRSSRALRFQVIEDILMMGRCAANGREWAVVVSSQDWRGRAWDVLIFFFLNGRPDVFEPPSPFHKISDLSAQASQ